jgi:hypothetical protein
MAHEQGAMTVSRGRRGRGSGSVILTSILTGGGLAGRGRMLELGWNGSRQPSPNRMLARSLAPLTIDPCLALDKAGAAQVQKIMAEDRNKRTVVWVQSPQTPQTSSGEADCEVEQLGVLPGVPPPCVTRGSDVRSQGPKVPFDISHKPTKGRNAASTAVATAGTKIYTAPSSTCFSTQELIHCPLPLLSVAAAISLQVNMASYPRKVRHWSRRAGKRGELLHDAPHAQLYISPSCFLPWIRAEYRVSCKPPQGNLLHYAPWLPSPNPAKCPSTVSPTSENIRPQTVVCNT